MFSLLLVFKNPLRKNPLVTNLDEISPKISSFISTIGADLKISIFILKFKRKHFYLIMFVSEINFKYFRKPFNKKTFHFKDREKVYIF